MTTFDASAGEPPPSGVTVAHAVYFLHAVAIVTGIVGAATVVGSFVGSVPSIVAVILNYAKRGSVSGTWASTHYRWQIRTFWFALLWFCVGWMFIFTIIGAIVGVPVLVALTIWLIYRIVRGWLRLLDRRPMYV